LLALQIRSLMASAVAEQVEKRIGEFKALHLRGNEDWFSELCFCILTAYSSAKLGIRIQSAIGADGFLRLPEKELASRLKQLGHRFSEQRAHFIVEARKFSKIKDIVIAFRGEAQSRQWLARNVTGLGYKEASHFLRNVGYDDVAVLDRHILRTMCKYKLIAAIPRTLTKRSYLEIESRLRFFGAHLEMPLSKLDLYIWYMSTGEVLK
jgi:N-glycosylase/DNA lyase